MDFEWSDSTQAWTSLNCKKCSFSWKIGQKSAKISEARLWLPYFLHFHFLRKTKKKGPFFAKNEKKSYLCYKCYNHLTGKNFYTRIFFIFLSLFMLETMWSFRNLSKMSNIEPKIGKKWRKFIFHFLSSHFSRKTKNWKNAKTKNFLFRWDP